MVVFVNSGLTFPTVTQQDCFRILRRIEIRILEIPFFASNGSYSTGCHYFFRKFPGGTVCP